MNNKPKRGHGFIYKYTSPSGKSYIGQTVQSLSDRAGHNGKNYLGCSHFWHAIQKYGWENFIVEILGEFKVEDLNYQERRFIEIFNTLAPNGYNIQAGGDNGRKIIYQYDNQGFLMRSWPGLKQASTALNVSISSLSACLLGKTKTCAGYYWSYQLLEKYPVGEKIDNTEKLINMCDINNNVLKTFTSIAEAAKFVNGNRSALKKCCRGEIKSAYGYKWRCTEVLKEKKYNNTPIEIQQLNKDTLEVIQTFKSVSQAARAMNASGTSAIRRVLDDMNHSAYGYRWRRSQGSTTNDS